MLDYRRLTVLGCIDIAIGVGVWALTGSAAIGLALILAGVAVLVFAAVRAARTSDPETARRNEAADAQREAGRTAAETENLEDRGPSTGGQ